ncbi:MAG TPA: ATP-binding cassette domain-containing protein [Candidatus Elarobacter sp.]|jgi:ribose transport system ATP-binding protein|nr:ATP-binding cassette domain-containing protein [Candidatus Elarobacter sp.]
MTAPAAAAQGSASLAIAGLTKYYGATVALRDVSLEVRSGEIHALLGENGAGKSTLVKILNGIVVPDAGTILVGGAPFRAASPAAAQRAGVATAFQELSLLPNLSVATNLMLPRLVKGFAGLASPAANERAARAILREFGAAEIDPNATAGELSLGERQRIEIVRALSREPRLLLLDEPTAALADPAWLFAAIRRLAAGGTAVLYITHRLAEVRALCARATILRNGANVGTVDLASTGDAEIFRMIAGGSLAGRANGALPAHRAASAPALEARGLSGTSLSEIGFTLHRGEILGVAALEGQGQRELFAILGGSARAAGGTVTANGDELRHATPAAALRDGIGVLPEERKTEAIFPGLRTSANISLPILARLRRFGLIDSSRERRTVDAEATAVDLPPRYLGMDVTALSGGNQQKALVARVLLSGARTLVLYDPTRGVDVATKQVIYEVVRRFVRDEGSVLLYSTELAELVELADRCLVMYRGRIVAEVAGDALSETHLIALATGHAVNGETPREEAPPPAPRRAFAWNGTAVAFAIYLVLLAFFAAREPHALSAAAVNDLFDNALPLALAAAGGALVVLTRNFDLSVAGVVALTNVLMATALPDGPRGALLGLLLASAVGLGVGAVNGVLVAFAGLQSVASTLATMTICSGAALLILDAPGGTVPSAIGDLITGNAAGYVPAAALVALAVALGWIALRRTDWGVGLYAVGADEYAASLAGIDARRTKMLAFCLAGVLYGWAGYALSGVTTTGDPNAGNVYLILTYAAIAVGGVSFRGGRGGVIGAMIGAATLSLLQKVLFSAGVVSFYTGIAQGVAMIVAVLIGTLSERAPSRRAR